MTSASTSSSTRPDPSARRPSSSAATWRRSPTADVVCRSLEAPLAICVVSSSRNTISAPPLRPSRTRSRVLQRVLGDAFAVDVRAVAAAAIAEHEGAVFGGDFGVVARHIAAHQLQVVAAAAADREHRLVDVDHTPTQGVSDLETTVCHRWEAGIIARRSGPSPSAPPLGQVPADGHQAEHRQPIAYFARHLIGHDLPHHQRAHDQHEELLPDTIAIKRPVAAAAVPEHEGPVFRGDFRVVA